MQIERTARGYRDTCERWRREGRRVALVPTMGALHAGHLALVDEARRHADAVAVSIFVNPTQFGPNEDFSKYPRSFESDVQACRDHGASLVFNPTVEEMYPAGDATRVTVTGLTTHLCGRSRPGHFEGVATVVAKLFCLTGACVAVFGRKDYQQLKVVERLALDLGLPVEVVGHPIVREADGLALSSRNAYLSSEDRARAVAIPRSLSAASRAFATGERSAAALLAPLRQELLGAGLRTDYATLADAECIDPFDESGPVPERCLLAVAAFAGTTRLIDNVVLGQDPPPVP